MQSATLAYKNRIVYRLEALTVKMLEFSVNVKLIQIIAFLVKTSYSNCPCEHGPVERALFVAILNMVVSVVEF